MAVQILCVDDVDGVASDYAKLVETKTGLECASTSDVDEALELIQAHPISVAVLDQKMPQMSGTDLYRRMLKHNPRLKAVMLTGEADAWEAAEALQLLEYVRVIDKSKIDDLIPAIHVAIARAEAARTIAFPEAEVGRLGIHWIPWIPKSTFFLQSIELLRDAHVPDQGWRFLSEINAGERRTLSRQYTSERNFTAMASSELHAQSGIDALIDFSKFGKIRAGLNTRIASRMQTQREREKRDVRVSRRRDNKPTGRAW